MRMKPHTMHTCSQTHMYVFEMGARLREPGPAEECFPDRWYQSSHLPEFRRGVGRGAAKEGPRA